ncbi:MAG: ThiF family adenylyltransferase [Candidatus Obscuribacterales bacterium]|nr:ThiF family adenylyltransferase [Candidatus Obscuribacterales bacterium]
MINAIRHLSVFDPQAFGTRRIDVIGAGATGSKVVLSLAKLGLTNIHVWDFDQVEAHNVANQVFGNDDIGKNKVDALKEIVERQTGTQIHVHNERVDGSQELGAVVFLLTDSMSSRKEIWERGIKFKPRTKLLIETRMGADSGRVYTLNPCKAPLVKGYEGTHYSDEFAQVSACGASTSVGPTAGFISELAVWQLIRWFAIEEGGDDQLNNEIVFAMRPPLFMLRDFES